jgi:soluble lytic murein transglycosylase
MRLNLTLKRTLSLTFSMLLPTEALAVAGSPDLISPVQSERECREQHAQELLGKLYKRSAFRNVASVSKINNEIYTWTRSHLPKAYKKKYKEIAKAIIDEAAKYEFDPVFLVSVIQGESAFHPAKIGGVGEIGLMQIRPTTARWIAGMYGLYYKGRKSLFNPRTNIRLGAAYLDYLRDKFDMHAQLYLAAYNMGQRNVENILERNIWPKDYLIHVMKRYMKFYSTLREKQKRAAATTEKSKDIGSSPEEADTAHNS